VQADGLLCHACIFLANGVYRATITKGNSLLRRVRPPDTLSSASAVEGISVVGPIEGATGKKKKRLQDNLLVRCPVFAFVVFTTTAYADYGSSGSPVFNEYGRVIGILYAINRDTGRGTVVAMNVVWEALKLTNPEHPEGFVTGVNIAGVDLRDADDKLTDGDDVGSR
jgi:hypothetical protein